MKFAFVLISFFLLNSVSSLAQTPAEARLVHLSNGDEIPVETSLSDEDLNDLAKLPPELQAQAFERAQEILELTTDLILSEKTADLLQAGHEPEVITMKIEGSKPRRFAVARDWVRERLLTGVMGNDKTLYHPAPKDLKLNQKFMRYLRLAWQFALVETVHAAIEYYDQFKTAPKMVEFGVSFDLKIEPQIFIGKFNPTQKVKALRNSYGLALELSFDKSKMRPAIHTRLRREKGSGGLGLPAAKAEIKFFQTDGTHGVQSGKSWYPISPPVASFVLDRDSHGHYFAQGLTVGVNLGDLIPLSTLTNTFADYQQKQDPIDFQHLPETATQVLNKAARAVMPPRRPLTCSQLFAN